MTDEAHGPGFGTIRAGTDNRSHKVTGELLVFADADRREVSLEIQNSLSKVAGESALRHGGVVFAYDVAITAFEEALENGLRLDSDETQRLLKAIMKASKAFD